MPNPAGTGPNTASYMITDGVVHDNITCLDWQQAAPSDTYNWDTGIAYCDSLSLGGYDDWRVPTRIELMSIMDWTASAAKVDGSAFPGAASGYHLTASVWYVNRDMAWIFNLSDGITSNNHQKATAERLRCVRGSGTGEPLDELAQEPPDHYTVISADEVQDNYTKLIWQRDGDATTLVSWDEAVNYCSTLMLGGHDNWRLPTIRELSTLVDEAQVAPAINREMFPNTHYKARSNNWYWASHKAINSSFSWGINFDDGFTGFNSGAAAWNTFGPSYAKCVRDE